MVPTFTKRLILIERGRRKIFKTSESEKQKLSLKFKGVNQRKEESKLQNDMVLWSSSRDNLYS